MHVFQNFETRNNLLLVCQRWYTVATQFSALWRSDHVGQRMYSVRNLTRCNSITGLLTVLKRTAHITFDLRMTALYNPPNNDEIQLLNSFFKYRWLCRCRSLELSISDLWVREDEASYMKEIISNGQFDALEYLMLFDESFKRNDDILNLLLAQLEATALSLKTLKLIFSHYSHHAVLFSQFHSGLNRLTSLTLVNVSQPIPWEWLKHLEHLDFYARFSGNNTKRSCNLSQLVAPRLTSLHLAGRFSSSNYPSKTLFMQLKRLSILSFATEGDENIFPSSFPFLTYLRLGSHKISPFKYVHSNVIKELYIRDLFSSGYLSVDDVEIRPVILHLDTLY